MFMKINSNTNLSQKITVLFSGIKEKEKKEINIIKHINYS